MDCTSTFEETSAEESEIFNASSSMIPSTPLTYLPNRKRKHDEIDEFYPSSPKFSSTFNESFITNLKDFHLQNSPSTPDKHLLSKSVVMPSPIEESRKILYSSIKIVKPERKFGTPFKKDLRNINFGKQTLLKKILSIDVIMNIIFKYLSGGDLYRFSMVSRAFYKALETNKSAFERYKVYKNIYKDNKENYVITPPASPEKCDSPPRTISETFNKFFRVGQRLPQTHSLTKCRKCDDVAIVDNGICQCQNKACGLIYCRNCSSFSESGPENFKDGCGRAVLRPKLGNVSNCMEDSVYCNIFSFSNHDSGFYSETESPVKVRRNLFATLPNETPKPLSVYNKNKVTVRSKKKEQMSYVPVVVNKDVKKQADYDSPPRYGYAVCSKQSKRSLKRLTR